MPGQRGLLKRGGLVRSGSVATLVAFVLLCLTASAASATPGQVFAFGENYYGQLGSTANNGTQTANPNPSLLSLPGAVGPVVRLAAGEFHSLALTSAGQLYAFGDNEFGQLGSATNNATKNANPTPAPLSLPGATGPVVQVAAGRNFSLALTATGQLYAFGENYYGQLGNSTSNGTTNANPTPTIVSLPGATGPVVQVAAGAFHSLALTSTGQLFAFGENYYGELGNTTNNEVDQANPTPTLVTLPGATGPIVGISAGAYHSLAITSNGELYAFGYNYYGQLGNTTNNEVTAKANPTPTVVTLPGATGPVSQVAGGYAHSVALTASGQVFTFGYNGHGQLGTTTNSGSTKANPTPTLVGLPGTVGSAVQVATGEYDSYVVTSSGQLYAFGSNKYGQLGNTTNTGTETANTAPTLVAFPFGTTIDAIGRGSEPRHVLALVAELSVLSSTLPAGQVGAPYHASAASAGGTGAFSWSASGLPAGLSIAPDGQISGTPTSAGASNVVLHVTDIFGLTATSATIALTIAPAASAGPILVAGKAPTVAQLKASLLAQLGVGGKAARINALLKSKSYSLSFKALSAGTLSISWYFLPPGAHIAKKKKVKPVLFASGKLTFNAPATKKITIKLTGRGLGLIKHRRSIKLTATGSFKPTGKAAVTAKRTLTLKR